MKIRTIHREGTFWQGAFLAAYGELLRRHPQSEKVLPGARIASLARNMADDCERVRMTEDGGTCGECKGVGCEACKFTGREGDVEGLHAPPVERGSARLTMIGGGVGAVDVGGEAPPNALPKDWGPLGPPGKGCVSALEALAESIDRADQDTEVKRRERFGGSGGGAEPES